MYSYVSMMLLFVTQRVCARRQRWEIKELLFLLWSEYLSGLIEAKTLYCEHCLQRIEVFPLLTHHCTLNKPSVTTFHQNPEGSEVWIWMLPLVLLIRTKEKVQGGVKSKNTQGWRWPFFRWFQGVCMYLYSDIQAHTHHHRVAIWRLDH